MLHNEVPGCLRRNKKVSCRRVLQATTKSATGAEFRGLCHLLRLFSGPRLVVWSRLDLAKDPIKADSIPTSLTPQNAFSRIHGSDFDFDLRIQI